MVAGTVRGGAESFLRPTEPAQGVHRTHVEHYEGAAARSRSGGPLTRRQPIAEVVKTFPGQRRNTFFEDYYNRVYVLPGVIDYGAVAATVRRDFYVWNAWLKSVTMERVLTLDVDGTEIEGVHPPFTYLPLGLFRYAAEASVDGPAKFLATYTFEFDTDETPRLILQGERARLLPFKPNWRESYSVSYEYKTDVFMTRGGREQRRALRRTPRKTIEYTSSVYGPRLAAWNRHMASWHEKVVVIAEEPSFVDVQADVPAGNSVFAVAAVPDWLQLQTNVFVRSIDGAEVVSQVVAIVGTNIGLAGPLDFDLRAGSKVMLAVYGRIPAEVSSTRETSTVAEADITFEATPGIEQDLPLRPVAIELDGRPVFTRKPNWREQPELTYAHAREVVDYGVGRITVSSPIDFGTRTYDFYYSGLARNDVRDVVELFRRMRGRAGEFYYPSWENDLPFDAPLVAGTRTMTFSGPTMFEAYEHDRVHRAVAVQVKSGEFVFNRMIEDPTYSEGRSIFTFAHPWPETIEAGAPIMTSWLYASRFATDKLVVEWLTRQVAQIKTTFTTLEDLPYVV